MNSIKDKPKMSLWVGGLFLIAFMALLLGIGLRFEAASRARQENAERNDGCLWPRMSKAAFSYRTIRSARNAA
jgi:hypothetical protein